ncbi:MAG: hypothetical protein JXR83_14295 [Deltaproteobacteria bacterium]|nr:hypothetical protein [Deltaproteobacteria bacterium]
MFAIAGEIELRGELGGGRCAAVDSPLIAADQRYRQQRLGRLAGVVDKAGDGRLFDAAMDVLQFCSPGSQIADAARALGLVRDESGKNALSAIVNGLLGGPLGALAALGDGEDALQAALPRLHRLRQRADEMVAGRCGSTVPCAPGGHVPAPQERWQRRPVVAGYARCSGGQIDLAAYARSDAFRVALQARFRFPTFGSAFGRDLPRLTAGSDGELAGILSDPGLSFEDKLFHFMLEVAKNQEQKMEELMKKYDVAQAKRKQKEQLDNKVGQAQGIMGSVGGVVMGINPLFGLPIQCLTQAMGSIPDLVEAADGVKGALAGDSSALTKEQSEWSEQRWMMELQREQEKLTKTYNLISNLMKAWSDTQMNAVRNLR